MIQCQHVQVDWGLNQPAESTLTGRWTECAPVSCLLCSEEGENTRIFSSRPLAKTHACLVYCSHKRDTGEMESWNYKFTPHNVCISALWLDETYSLFRKPMVCVAFSFMWISTATISSKSYMPNVGAQASFCSSCARGSFPGGKTARAWS